MCENTTLVEWNLYDDEHHHFEHVKGRSMTISQDGNSLLTSDHVGTMSIYQLVNRCQFIRGLAFSPDGQRFYDIRASICNV